MIPQLTLTWPSGVTWLVVALVVIVVVFAIVVLAVVMKPSRVARAADLDAQAEAEFRTPIGDEAEQYLRLNQQL